MYYFQNLPILIHEEPHKWFNFGRSADGVYIKDKTIITKEYPDEWRPGLEPYYPVLDAKNLNIYEQYNQYAKNLSNFVFGGRLGEYKYFDMDQIILSAMDKYASLTKCDQP